MCRTFRSKVKIKITPCHVQLQSFSFYILIPFISPSRRETRINVEKFSLKKIYKKEDLKRIKTSRILPRLQFLKFNAAVNVQAVEKSGSFAWNRRGTKIRLKIATSSIERLKFITDLRHSNNTQITFYYQILFARTARITLII